MAIDIRATVTCSLGLPLISASISDDYVQGTGLIKCRGTADLSGVITPKIGTQVTFSYTKSGVTRTVPRVLRVLSSFADPFRQTTKVELGCKLTYLADLQEPIEWDAYKDADNSELTEEDARIVTRPISANSVMRKCLSELGITASSNPLTNRFSVDEYDFSGGYVSVLSDLLVSECYCGYLDVNETLQVHNLNQDSATAAVLDSTQIIDLGPIGVGQLPGEAVIVNYSTLKLDEDPNTSEIQKRNWEKDETIGAPTTVSVPNPTFGSSTSTTGKTRTFEYTYTPRSVVVSEYDRWDRLTTRTTTNYTILAELAPSYLQHIAAIAVPWGSREYETKEITTVEYEVPESLLDAPPENYEKVAKETTFRYEPYVKLMASTQIYDLAARNQVEFSYKLGPSNTFLAEVLEVTQESTSDVAGALVAKTLTSISRSFGYTQRGQQMLGQIFSGEVVLFEGTLPGAVLNPTQPGGLYSNGTAELAIENATRLVSEGVETRIAIGREINLQKRPSAAERINNDVGAQRVNSSSELELALGSTTAQRRIEFSMPKAPDDHFIKVGGSYRSSKSDAEAKARRYGRIQNRLLLGNRSGMNIQTAPELVPDFPFASVVMAANGLSALYKLNGTSWQMDATGMLLSSDLLFWGAVGGTGTFWFPVAPGVTTLPTTPPIADGTMVVDTVVPIWTETISVNAVVKLGAAFEQLNYQTAEQLSPQVLVKAGITCSVTKPVEVPSALMGFEAPAVWLMGYTGTTVTPSAVSVPALAPVPVVDGADFIVDPPVANAVVVAQAVALARNYVFVRPVATVAVDAEPRAVLLQDAIPSGAATDIFLAAGVAVQVSVFVDVEVGVPVAVSDVSAAANNVQLTGRYTFIKKPAVNLVNAAGVVPTLDGQFAFMVDPPLVVVIGTAPTDLTFEDTYGLDVVAVQAAPEAVVPAVSLPELEPAVTSVGATGRNAALLDCTASETSCALHVGGGRASVELLEPTLLLLASDRTTLLNVRQTVMVEAQKTTLVQASATTTTLYGTTREAFAAAPAPIFVAGNADGSDAVPFLVICNSNAVSDEVLGVRIRTADGVTWQMPDIADLTASVKEAYVFMPEGYSLSDFTSSVAFSAVEFTLGIGVVWKSPSKSLGGFTPSINGLFDLTIYSAVPSNDDSGVRVITGYLGRTARWSSDFFVFPPGGSYTFYNLRWGST